MQDGYSQHLVLTTPTVVTRDLVNGPDRQSRRLSPAGPAARHDTIRLHVAVRESSKSSICLCHHLFFSTPTRRADASATGATGQLRCYSATLTLSLELLRAVNDAAERYKVSSIGLVLWGDLADYFVLRMFRVNLMLFVSCQSPQRAAVSCMTSVRHCHPGTFPQRPASPQSVAHVAWGMVIKLQLPKH